MNITDIAEYVFWIAAAIWAYMMFGYPMLMALAGVGKRSCDVADDSDLPSVTMIIPAHNEEEAVIREKLLNTKKIDYPTAKLEIIVVSDGSADQTVPIAKEFEDQQIEVIDFTNRRGKTSIVNDAVDKASHDILCLCDTNVMFRPDAIKKMVARLVNPRIGAASGDVRLASHESDFGAGESVYYKFERAMQLGESRIGSMMGVDGGMYVIRKSLFQPPPAETILDDFVISIQSVIQGKKVVYEPEAIADENGTPSSDIEYRRRIRVTAGAVQTIRWGIWPSVFRQPVACWQWVSHKLLRWLSPIWLIVLLVSNLLLWNEHLVYQVFLGMQLFFYAIATVGWLLPRLRGYSLISLCYYFALSHIAMLVGLYRGIRNQQKVTWKRTQRATA